MKLLNFRIIKRLLTKIVLVVLKVLIQKLTVSKVKTRKNKYDLHISQKCLLILLNNENPLLIQEFINKLVRENFNDKRKNSSNQ